MGKTFRECISSLLFKVVAFFATENFLLLDSKGIIPYHIISKTFQKLRRFPGILYI